MTCKDCFYYDILCKDTLQDDELQLCDSFKNKADFVEVVRCGECKHFGCRYKGISGEDVGYCYNNQNNGFPFLCDSRPCMRATDFCSYGERKEP